MAKSSAFKPLSLGCLVLFGFPFLGAGLFMSWFYFSGFVSYWDAQRWHEVPCWIESADLEVSHGESTTYKATATYRYEYEGRAYDGDRVAFDAGSDNVGSFQQDAHRELSSYAVRKPEKAEKTKKKQNKQNGEMQQGAGKPFRCYVNPAKPSEAVLYRNFRWQMKAFFAIFALTFPAVGAGVMLAGFLALKTSRRESHLREQHPGEPWKWKADWALSCIPESNHSIRKAVYLYTLWSALIIFPLIWISASSGVFQQEKSSWLLMIFVAIWCIPAWHSIKSLRQRLSLGDVRFELKESPAWPGGTMDGSIVSVKPLPSHGDAEVTLICEKKVTVRSGENTSTTKERIWSHQEKVLSISATRDDTGFRLPVSFAIPLDAPESDSGEDANTKHVWKLEFKVPGTAVCSVFEIPVFRTEKSTVLAAKNAPEMPSISEFTNANLPALLAAQRINSEFDPAGLPTSIVCPAARQGSLIVFLIVFDVIWTAAAVFLIKQQAPLIFLIVWPCSAAILWLIVLWLLLHKRGVTFSETSLEVRNQLGPIIWTNVIEKAQIIAFSHDTNMSSNNTRFYRVRLENFLGKKHTLVAGITESTTAHALANRLENWRKAVG